MRPLHIIMPMAGEGSRFLKEGISTPKPLINIKGSFMFERALMNFDNLESPKKYSLIVRQEHIEKYDIEKKIKSVIPEAIVFSVKQTTRGAVETCLLVRQVIDENDAIVVLDCDLEFYSKSYNNFILDSLKKSTDEVNGGAIVSFDSKEPCYSYALSDQNNRVIRTAEKEVISHHALAGSFFFCKSMSFITAAELFLRDARHKNVEFYLSLLYNYLIENGESVFLAKTDSYYSYGTPEELRRYQDEPRN